MDTQLYDNKHIPKSWTHNYSKTNTYRSHGHATIRKQTHTEVMDTQLYDNKHIPKSWTHNYTKTNIYRSHGHTTIRKETYTEVMDTQLYDNKHTLTLILIEEIKLSL